MASKAIVKCSATQQQPQSSSIYRQATVGLALQDSLQELLQKGQISEGLVEKILQNFDKAVARAFSTRINNKATFKGTLNTYRYCENVWTMLLDDVAFKLTVSDADTVYVDRVQLTAVDSKTASSAAASSTVEPVDSVTDIVSLV
eukprot:TRINITY_DN27502_c0_g1_i1.p1 TRINITY_DN27502_c0_g1~~TRINITY_DN27502_c0_g1_i1.p1  ORF type:complete len:145 (+),score=30.22 TRINITY_DN27502_c0_g1_i1:159-593(+)